MKTTSVLRDTRVSLLNMLQFGTGVGIGFSGMGTEGSHVSMVGAGFFCALDKHTLAHFRDAAYRSYGDHYKERIESTFRNQAELNYQVVGYVGAGIVVGALARNVYDVFVQ